FGIRGGREACRKVIDNVKLWSHIANVGDAKSLIIHPESTTQQQLRTQDIKKRGVAEELIRLSIGIETVDDVLKDLDQAIAKATDEEPTIQPTAEEAVKWLLHSPFSRENGDIRKKVIAIINLHEDHNAFHEQVKGLQSLDLFMKCIVIFMQVNDSNYFFHEQVKGLQSLGYQIIPIHPTEETLVDEQTYPT